MPSLLTKERDTSVSQAEERRQGNPFGTGTETIIGKKSIHNLGENTTDHIKNIKKN